MFGLTVILRLTRSLMNCFTIAIVETRAPYAAIIAVTLSAVVMERIIYSIFPLSSLSVNHHYLCWRVTPVPVRFPTLAEGGPGPSPLGTGAEGARRFFGSRVSSPI